MWALWYVLCTPNLFASLETSCHQVYEAMPNPAYRWYWQIKEVNDGYESAVGSSDKQPPEPGEA